MNMRQVSIYFYLYMTGKSERCKEKLSANPTIISNQKRYKNLLRNES